jgi:hypothetical protein
MCSLSSSRGLCFWVLLELMVFRFWVLLERMFLSLRVLLEHMSLQPLSPGSYVRALSAPKRLLPIVNLANVVAEVRSGPPKKVAIPTSEGRIFFLLLVMNRGDVTLQILALSEVKIIFYLLLPDIYGVARDVHVGHMWPDITAEQALIADVAPETLELQMNRLHVLTQTMTGAARIVARFAVVSPALFIVPDVAAQNFRISVVVHHDLLHVSLNNVAEVVLLGCGQVRANGTKTTLRFSIFHFGQIQV